MFDFEDNKELVVCSKPPVNGNVCDKFIAIDTSLNKIVLVWNDELSGFVVEGTEAAFTYSQLERSYDKFIWVKYGK
ncbi:hypothetical protein NVP1067O_45 [Vibrio phage 1.067.O._10N.261.52.C9]|nr:hypothetical protein NVP1003O_37 [Vibrio phage 1.003.O._10N.286.48.A2]AUR85057.1 hypothetical protein NVP1067O_45 [Vibrio phage 1.067.O._10N.261.52.C9]AUR85683.1 hypothetical protein NVP1079O_39 [Vibrio phage 1.079.O._10N.286.45.E9]